MKEYYIREEGDEDARGPYDIDQLTSMVAADKLQASAYFYDIEKEEWLKIESNTELMGILYPEKKRLSLKKKEEPSPDATKGKKADDAAAPDSQAKEKADKPKEITISDMLAQAEGRSGEDHTGKTPQEKKAIAAYIGMRGSTLLLFLSCAAMFLIDLDLLKTGNLPLMAKSPYLIVGIIDFAFAGLLLLQVTEIYPLIRFRAAIGLGLFSVIFYSTGDPILIASNAWLMISLYFCTALITRLKVLIALLVGLVGFLGYAYAIFLS